MCGIIVTNIKKFDLNYINYYVKKRGPDLTNHNCIRNINFIHNLLHITGVMCPQPLIDNDIVCLFNGEIYNFKKFGDFNSDGECLIYLYKTYGFDFVKKLDGEFAIVLVDFSKKIILLSKDHFGTKPLWYAINNNNFGISSYKSSLDRLKLNNSIEIENNITLILDLDKLEEKKKITNYVFDLKQYKNNFDDWNKAFDNAILKRTMNTDKEFLIGLSSGHDSGSISCSLLKQDISHLPISIIGSEDLNILMERKNLYKNIKFFQLNNDIINDSKKKIIKNAEMFEYVWMGGNPKYYKSGRRLTGYTKKMIDDPGACGLSYIIDKSKKINKNIKIILSGIGGDEIYYTYGSSSNNKWNVKLYGSGLQPDYFPSNLDEIYPWKNLYGNTMKNYITMNEIIGGMHGYETRYPFLDNDLFQEFLWLSSELKNKYFKSPLSNYMTINNYPFKNNFKKGFNSVFKQNSPLIDKLLN